MSTVILFPGSRVTAELKGEVSRASIPSADPTVDLPLPLLAGRHLQSYPEARNFILRLFK